MRTPTRPLPDRVVRWTRRVRWLRWLDAVAAWVVLWTGSAFLLRSPDGRSQAVLAVVLVGVLALASPLRRRWRPLSGLAALVVSRPLRPGDRAWHVRPGKADLVLVTARRGLCLVIAWGAHEPGEGITVRRTRAVLVPADPV